MKREPGPHCSACTAQERCGHAVGPRRLDIETGPHGLWKRQSVCVQMGSRGICLRHWIGVDKNPEVCDHERVLRHSDEEFVSALAA